MEVVRGLKLWWIISSLCVGLLLSSLESTIVATALVSIASDFGNYGQSNWIVVSYLVTYSSFLIIFARLSDVTGRKPALLTGLLFFTVSSLACGLAQTFTQLVVFRAFQGVGGSGIYALTMVISAEITPLEQLGTVSGIIGTVFAVASAVGPVIGGAISSNTTWRWCFYLNIPSGALVIVLIVFIFPSTTSSDITFKRSVSRIDWIGCMLCLAASVIVVIPLEEGGGDLGWNSAPIIAMFAIGGLCWVSFASWETFLSYTRRHSELLPMMPVDIAVHRIIGACILTSMLTGLAFTSTIVYLPQRLQIQNGLSAVHAGTHMLPLVITSALSSTITGVILGKTNICSYFITLGNSLQLVGLGLNSSLRSSAAIPPEMYGYQVIVGLGFGMSLSSSFILARIEVPRKDIAPTMGAITQLRVFGGVVGVAICRVVLSSFVKSNVPPGMPGSTLSDITSSSQDVSSQEMDHLRLVNGAGFSFQSRILMYIAVANVLLALMTFRRHAKPLKEPSIPEVTEGQETTEQNRTLSGTENTQRNEVDS